MFDCCLIVYMRVLKVNAYKVQKILIWTQLYMQIYAKYNTNYCCHYVNSKFYLYATALIMSFVYNYMDLHIYLMP